MLQQVCEHIHNYFIASTIGGTFEISGGMISPLSLLEGQRFLIQGSVLNDGVYTYHADGITNDDDNDVSGLVDEPFTGYISTMAVPRSVITLTAEISDWRDKYGAAVQSPFSSETVNGVYTYVKTTKSEEGGGGGYSWQDVFKARLNRWRKAFL